MTKSLMTVLSITVLMLVLLVLPASACGASYQPYELLNFDHDLAKVLSLFFTAPIGMILLIPSALVSFFVYWKVLSWKSFGQALLLNVITYVLLAAFFQLTSLSYFDATCRLVHSCAGEMLTIRDQISYGIAIGMFAICVSAQLSIYSLSGSLVRPRFVVYTLTANALAAAFAGSFAVSTYAKLVGFGCFFSP